MHNSFLPLPALLAGFIALVLAVPALAQIQVEGSSSGTSPLDRYVAQISEDLDLTPDQQKRIRPVLAASMTATMSALKDRNDNRVKEGDKRDPFAEGRVQRNERKLGQEMREIRSDTRESLADILTPEQLALYQKMREESRQRMRELVRSRRNQ